MNSRLFFLILLGTCCFSLQAKAQNQVQYSGWFSSFNAFALSKKFNTTLDVQVKSSDEAKYLQSVLIRPGLSYRINKKFSVAAGFTYTPSRKSLNTVTGYLSERSVWQHAVFAYKW